MDKAIDPGILRKFSEILEKKAKHVKYDFQELGLMLAKKLGEWNRRSFYMRLAKLEDRRLVMQAFMYAADAPINKRAGLFLWKLTQLKEQTHYRAFVGVFFDKEKNTQLLEVYNQIKGVKLVPFENLHYTLAFWGRLKGVDYPKVVDAVSKLRAKYNFPVEITWAQLDTVENKYLWLLKASASAYRLFYGFRKILVQKKLNHLVKQMPQKPKPHITLARLKKGETKEVKIPELKKPVVTYGNVYFVISRLTPKGPIYKRHEYY